MDIKVSAQTMKQALSRFFQAKRKPKDIFLLSLLVLFFLWRPSYLRQELPLFEWGLYLPGIDAPFIGTDFEDGGYIATKYLLENGHKNIAAVLGQPKLVSTHERLSGYSKALKEAGISFKEQYVRYGSHTAESGQQNTENLLKAFPEITAIFSVCDISIFL